ncbi:MAG: hypothetical protein NVS4B8_13380 [Herpetosiphon sp.]
MKESAPPVISAVPVPTQAPAVPAVSPTIIPQLADVGLPLPPLDKRWEQLQADRKVFAPERTYTSPSHQLVWWFDPINMAYVPIGEIKGDFSVQASFRIKGSWATGLEIPFGLTKKNYEIGVPAEIVQRMKDAGKNEWVTVFIYQTKDIQPR